MNRRRPDPRWRLQFLALLMLLGLAALRGEALDGPGRARPGVAPR